jgi:hypothetical protein
VKNGAERGVGFGLLGEVMGNGDVENLRGISKSRSVGRFAFLAPLAHFANLRHDGIFGFGRRVSEGVPQDGIGVKVGVSV